MSLFGLFHKIEDFLKAGNDAFSAYLEMTSNEPVDFTALATDAMNLATDLHISLPNWVNLPVIIAFVQGGLDAAKSLKPTS